MLTKRPPPFVYQGVICQDCSSRLDAGWPRFSLLDHLKKMKDEKTPSLLPTFVTVHITKIVRWCSRQQYVLFIDESWSWLVNLTAAALDMQKNHKKWPYFYYHPKHPLTSSFFLGTYAYTYTTSHGVIVGVNNLFHSFASHIFSKVKLT